MEGSIRYVLSRYNIDPSSCRWEKIGSGHIHETFKVTTAGSYVLQKFNDKVFTRPEIVERNIQLASNHLKIHYPEYLFIAPMPSADGHTMVSDTKGNRWRLFNYVENSYSIDEAKTVDQAFKASAAFGRLGKLLSNCDVTGYRPSIERFHDLSFRYQQFLDALKLADPSRVKEADPEIMAAKKHSAIANEYDTLVSKGILKVGVFHNDTKINNVLFDKTTNGVAAVVDLDTLMPGYFIYDLGDLVRTIVSPVSEEEKNIQKVEVRQEFYKAVIDGYLSEMNDSLSQDEQACLSFAGQMMTYIMGLRFLADFLRGDTYYHTTYPGQNLVRAKNQLALLALLADQK
jgi:Ser/Thr protein kinase RdoA (MazF antagonist)